MWNPQGPQAEYRLVPNAQANLARIPDDVTDEQVVLLSDIASTGISGAESGGVRIGDSVAVFAHGPIGLCAALGAKLMGAALRRLIEMVRRGNLDLRPLLTPRFKLADINQAYKLFGARRDGVMKVVITPLTTAIENGAPHAAAAR